MKKFEFKLPKMGESVAEATITSWLKGVGDRIEKDEILVNIATDKVDSEIPSEMAGVVTQILFNTNDVVQVGATMAIIELDQKESDVDVNSSLDTHQVYESINLEEDFENSLSKKDEKVISNNPNSFFSPLVKKIAEKEGISLDELKKIDGTGLDARVTKNDVLKYLSNQQSTPQMLSISKDNYPLHQTQKEEPDANEIPKKLEEKEFFPTNEKIEDGIVEISRMGKLISDHMIKSRNTSVHVQSFIEADVTKIVTWRNRVKDEFYKRYNEKITFTPIFMLAVARAIRSLPMINISFTGDKIVKKRAINLGMAVSLPDGNLIVPVIKNADFLSLRGMITAVNDLALRARNNQLKPDDVKDGTYTVTNIGVFGSIFGTPIINQPQVGILALGAIRKVPSVIETKDGDFIGIRHKMYISHTFDHRVVNGALGGYFNKEVKELLEDWDENTIV